MTREQATEKARRIAAVCYEAATERDMEATLAHNTNRIAAALMDADRKAREEEREACTKVAGDSGIDRFNMSDEADGLVAGDRLTISIADHILRCARLLEDEQAKIAPDNGLIDCLCESVRLAREHVHVVRSSGGEAKP